MLPSKIIVMFNVLCVNSPGSPGNVPQERSAWVPPLERPDGAGPSAWLQVQGVAPAARCNMIVTHLIGEIGGRVPSSSEPALPVNL